MSAAQTEPIDGFDYDREDVAERLVGKLVGLFGIEETRRILFRALAIAKHDYAEDSK